MIKNRNQLVSHGLKAGREKAIDIMNAALQCVSDAGVEDVIISSSACAGLCSREPMITVELAGQAPVKYVDMTPDKLKEVFDKHVVGGELVSDYALAVGSERVL